MADDQAPRIYSNHTVVEGGPFDVTLVIGFRRGDQTETEALISMSWEHAKVLGSVIQHAVADYESQVSLIPELFKEEAQS